MIVRLPFVLGAIFIALAVHMASVLSMPRLTANDLFARLLPRTPVNEVTPVSTEQAEALNLPFFDPAFEIAACRYDLSGGVLRLRAQVPETLLLVSLVAKGGGVYFTVTDRASIKGTVELLIGTDAQIGEIENADQEDASVGELRVRAPSRDGVAVIRAFAPMPSVRGRAAATVSQATCQIETLN